MADNQRFGAVISALLAVATAFLGWVTLRGTPGPLRPLQDRPSAEIPLSAQDVTARLWEDPLQAVQGARASQREDEAAHALPGFQKAISARLKNVQVRVCLMIVPVPSTSFPDDIETRLRLRYSVQMALAQADFAPEDRSHLGYVLMSWPGSGGSVHDQTNFAEFACPSPAWKGVPIPYEWFVSSNNSVLTLWLPEDLLGAETLCRFAYLARSMAPDTNEPSRITGPFVIGPRSSDTLKHFTEFRTGNHICTAALSEKLKIFSPQATAPDAVLNLSDPRGLPREKLNSIFTSRLSPGSDWRYFHNFIVPDDRLTDLLVKELDARGLNLNNEKLNNKEPAEVLILAEADTSYGRSLPRAFQASIRNARRGWALKTDSILSDHGLAFGTNIHVVRYLRGLDGKKGNSSESKENGLRKRSGSSSPEEALARIFSRSGEVSNGEYQLDYTERLVTHLIQVGSHGKIKAVGILGSDLYDKLFLLNALRPHFDDAIFFTTDLDARLSHPDFFPLTRNMVVASAYSLNANPSTTTGFQMPPFRDLYQVAVYEASFAALSAFKDRDTPIKPPPEPQVYELGRNGPVQLTPPAPAPGQPVHPREAILVSAGRNVSRWSKIHSAGLSLIAVSLIAGLLIFYRLDASAFWSMLKKGTGYAGWFFLAAVAALVMGGSRMHDISLAPRGEPWSWKDGISAWPTELMRVAILFVILWMLTLAWNRFQMHRARLASRFFVDEQDLAKIPADLIRPYGWRKVGWLLGRAFDLRMRLQSSASKEPVDAAKIFQRYIVNGSLGPRLIRITLGSLAYLAFGFGIMLLFGGVPGTPMVRGEEAGKWNHGLLTAVVLGSSFLLFYVLDAVRLSCAFLRQLAEGPTRWPSALVLSKAAKYAVKPRDICWYLDVKFAAEQTKGTASLLFLPFIVQFLMLVSRNNYWEHWIWQGNLVFILTCNVLIAVIAWFWLRAAAREVREQAIHELDYALFRAKVQPSDDTSDEAISASSDSDRVYRAHGEVGQTALTSPQLTITAEPADEKTSEQRQLGVAKLKERVENESRGAYARLVQDPALLAVLIPTGLLGILTVVIQLFFGAF